MGTTLWRSLFTLGLSGVGVVLYGFWGAAIDVRDKVLASSVSVQRIEQQLPDLWRSVNSHEARIDVLEATRGHAR